MKHRPKSRDNLPKRKKRAIRELQDAENALLNAYPCEDPYQVPEGVEPTLSDMLGIDECNLRKGE